MIDVKDLLYFLSKKDTASLILTVQARGHKRILPEFDTPEEKKAKLDAIEELHNKLVHELLREAVSNFGSSSIVEELAKNHTLSELRQENGY